MQAPWSRISFALALAGTILRTIQYAADASQWLDETLLSSSITSRSLHDLVTTPLAYGQTAPPGFLAAEWLLVSTCGKSDLCLRFVPFVAGVAGLWAFRYLSQRVLSPMAGTIAVSLFALAAPLIAYSAQVKQYSSDVAATVIVLALALDLLGDAVPRRRAVLAAVTGAALVWIAQPTVFVLAGITIASLYRILRGPALDAASQRRVIAVIVVWSASALGVVLCARMVMTAAVREYLHRYWASGFMPLPPWRPEAVVWTIRSITAIFGNGERAGLVYPMHSAYALLAVVGACSLFARRPRVGALVFAPVAVTLGAAAARQYPFADRLVLFLVPSMLLGVAEGLEWISTRVSRRFAGLGFAALALVLPTFAPVVRSLPPYRQEDIKPILAHVRAKRRPGERVYVYYGGEVAFRYYAERYGFQPGGYFIGGCHRDDNRGYLRELDRFRGGPPVWVVITHDLTLRHEGNDMLRYLDAIGARRDSISVASHSFHSFGPEITDRALAYLYDLSDAGRSAPISPETFPIDNPPVDPRYSCL